MIQSELQSKISNLDDTHGLIELAPRTGKTKIAIDIIKNEKASKILWVTPSSKLRDVDIPNEFIKWKAKTYLKKTKIITYASLKKIKGHYDKIILDEFQYVTPNNSFNLLNGNLTANSITGLSGTPSKHEEKIEILSSLNLKTIYKVDIDEAVELNILPEYQINVVNCVTDDTEKNIEVKTKNVEFKTTERKNYAFIERRIRAAMFKLQNVPKYFYINRMHAIHNSFSKLKTTQSLIKNLKGRILVFCPNIKVSEQISEHTYNSKTSDEKLNKFLNGEIDLLACVNSGGVGFTFKNVDHFVIMQANQNKNGDVTQKISRSLLKQENYIAKLHIICLKDTQDQKWVDEILKDFKNA